MDRHGCFGSVSPAWSSAFPLPPGAYRWRVDRHASMRLRGSPLASVRPGAGQPCHAPEPGQAGGSDSPTCFRRSASLAYVAGISAYRWPRASARSRMPRSPVTITALWPTARSNSATRSRNSSSGLAFLRCRLVGKNLDRGPVGERGRAAGPQGRAVLPGRPERQVGAAAHHVRPGVLLVVQFGIDTHRQHEPGRAGA